MDGQTDKYSQVKEDEMTGHVARIWEKRGARSVLVGKAEGNRPLGRPRYR
jgi:hypothetical protein